MLEGHFAFVASSTIQRRAAPGQSAGIHRLVRRLETVRAQLRQSENRVPLARFGRSSESARNLIHYMVLRKYDLRKLQEKLADLGLSSLGRAESHVLYNLNTVLARLRPLNGHRPPTAIGLPAIDPDRGRRLLSRNASRLFGRNPPGRDTRIMVTMPTEAAHDRRLVRELLRSGMDCARINCAHDTERDWTRMIRNIRDASRELGHRCRIEMDLGGPRLRTGPLAPGPSVVRARPSRDAMGRVLTPARMHILPSGTIARPLTDREPHITTDPNWLRRRRVRDLVQFVDARGARRTAAVVSRSATGLVLQLSKTAYLTNGLKLEARRGRRKADVAVVGGVSPQPGRIRLRPGSWIRLRHGLTPEPEVGTDHPRSAVASIAVTSPEVLGRVQPGDRVWFDEGKIGGIVKARSAEGVRVRVDHSPDGGAWLRQDMGINMPDTDLALPPLTARDRSDLRFIVKHADVVGYSFVQSSDDVDALRQELARLGRPRMGLVLKIETRRAFEQLPEILLSALRSGPTAVMVARGDLAVEVGFERLAEVQEEILWLCEAAHLPTIWATQVLEGLAKNGIPSRAEVTDAAMGERAECVMLNKGPYLVEALRALDSIIRRMQAHQSKKSARLRHLAVAERFLASGLVE